MLVIGGDNALQTLVNAYDTPAVRGTDPAAVDRENRQHAWRSGDDARLPEHHLLLFTDYRHEGPPPDLDRDTAAVALDELEATFGWGGDGLVFTVGYSPEYFDRFGRQPLPDGHLEWPESTIRAIEDGTSTDPEEVTPDSWDVAIHMASDHVAHLLAAELALWGEQNALGVELETTLEGVFARPAEYPARRTGYSNQVGIETYGDAIEESPGPGDVTVGGDGPFADGTVMHVSKLDVDIEALRDHVADRAESGPHQGMADGGTPRATDETGSSVADRLLRRGIVATERESTSNHYVALMSHNRTIVEARRAMDAAGDAVASHVETERRGNYLVPPVDRRALPKPE